MANYDDFRKKAKDAFNTITDVSVEAYRLAEEKARIIAKKARLNAGIANERATIRRLNVEIGATYYKLNKDNPEDALKQQCEDVSAAYERIAARQAELEELKNCSVCGETMQNCECSDKDTAAEDCCADEDCDCEEKPKETCQEDSRD